MRTLQSCRLFPVLIIALMLLVAQGAQAVPETILTASDGHPGDYFGNAVSVDGDVAIVGAAGEAYVYERPHGGSNAWELVKKLTTTNSAGFAGPVAIAGDVIVVGLCPHILTFNIWASAIVCLRSGPGFTIRASRRRMAMATAA